MAQKILVIEDEPGIADNITYALSTEGFSPIWCSTGGEGLEQLEQNDISLIILDIGLPDISGFEVCKEVRKCSSIPIIFLTARADEVDRVVGLEIGGDDYVVKPFSPRELTARVKAVLRRPSEMLNKGDGAGGEIPFEIDQERKRVSYYGEPLELSRYEYRILCVLVRSPGRVYSRDQLMSLAWESPEMSMERTVDTHIKTVRQKLKVIKPDLEEIITHRGIGYSLKEA